MKWTVLLLWCSCVGAALIFCASRVYIKAPPEIPYADLSIRLLFVGDMMFDRGVARHAERHGADLFMFGVSELLHGDKRRDRPYDAVIGNLEGTITTEPSIAQKNNKILHFTFDPMFARVLKDAGFTHVSLANNHAMDFYRAGYVSTGTFLDGAGVGHFGSPYNNEHLTTTFTAKGKQICVVGYHDLYTFDETPVIAEIVRMRSQCQFVIVFPHWGVEYELTASDRQGDLAHEFIDAGADLVIGAHPHVVQPVEIYKGKAIFYSLGNFVFDQGLSFWTEHGLAVEVDLHQNGRQDFVLTPTVLHATEVSIATSTERTRVLRLTGIESGMFSVGK